MISALLGKKIGMAQIFQEGKCIPVTLLEVGPCTILQVKKQETDGYCALQLGFGERRVKVTPKPQIGHAKKHANTGPKKFIREVVWDGKDEVAAGQALTLAVLEKVPFVDIIGISKGRGFQGGVKKFHFAGGPTSHGESDRVRAPGAIGGSTPFRVFKGQRMAGHMGDARCTQHHVKVVEVNVQDNIIAVRGSVVGANGGYVIIRRSLRTPRTIGQ